MGDALKAVADGMDHPIFAWLVVGIAVFVAFLVLTGRLRKTPKGFELGDSTAFEKTNQRFKQLCMDTKMISSTVPTLIASVEKINGRLDSVEASEKRLELMQLMQASPGEKLLISRLYDDYKKAGLNSYIDSLFKEWRNDK
jgi:hypothetical protein